MNVRFRPIHLTVIGALAMSTWGCARVEYLPPSPETRARLGVVAVVPVPLKRSKEELTTPVKGSGEGALSGAGQGALGSIVGGGGGGCYSGPLGCVIGLALGIALAPVAAVVGGVVGADKAHTAEEVEAAEARLRAVLAGVRPDENLRDRIAALARDDASLTIRGRATADYGVSYRRLAKEGIDTVLETTVTRFGLESVGHIDPDLTLRLGVRTRLVSAADDAVLYDRTWEYRGETRNFFEMAADDATPLRTEIADAYQRMATAVVHHLFVATTPEVAARGTRLPGSVWTVTASSKRETYE